MARELSVQTPSLYHHFQDRADIVRTVARAIVLESRVPDPAAPGTGKPAPRLTPAAA